MTSMNTTIHSLNQNDLNKLTRDLQDDLRYQDLVRLADINGLSVQDALFAADEVRV